jgi:hypothetical protein
VLTTRTTCAHYSHHLCSLLAPPVLTTRTTCAHYSHHLCSPLAPLVLTTRTTCAHYCCYTIHYITLRYAKLHCATHIHTCVSTTTITTITTATTATLYYATLRYATHRYTHPYMRIKHQACKGSTQYVPLLYAKLHNLHCGNIMPRALCLLPSALRHTPYALCPTHTNNGQYHHLHIARLLLAVSPSKQKQKVIRIRTTCNHTTCIDPLSPSAHRAPASQRNSSFITKRPPHVSFSTACPALPKPSHFSSAPVQASSAPFSAAAPTHQLRKRQLIHLPTVPRCPSPGPFQRTIAKRQITGPRSLLYNSK